MTRATGAPSTTVVVLAAGAGSRFHDSGHKLLATLPASGGRPAESVVRRAVAAALAAGLGPVVVVTGRLTADELDLPSHPDLAAVANPDWASGQMTSLRAGLDRAGEAGSEAAVVGLGDQPGIEPGAWRAVAAAAHGGAPIAVATYDGRRGNPVALRAEVWDLLAGAGDEGARGLMQLRPDLVVPVPCTGSPFDIDTVEDLRRWQSSSSTNSP